MDRNVNDTVCLQTFSGSLSARRAWIEIVFGFGAKLVHSSLSARRAWIEILTLLTFQIFPPVALRKESVDRNSGVMRQNPGEHVALRKESVDRNKL